MLKKKKTTASGKLVLVKSVRRHWTSGGCPVPTGVERRPRSHRMKFCVQRGLGALPRASKRRGKSRRDFLPCGPVCINTGIACRLYREFLIQGVIRNSELSGTWFVIPFVPFSYKNKFPITFCLFLIFPNDDI